MRIGIFGGTFDPVHLGHLLIAETCREQCLLSEILFVPAAIPPHKQRNGISSAKDRLAMLELAIAGNPHFRLSTLETDRGGVSYTVETLESLHAQRPLDEMFLIMGADSLNDLPTWRQPERICELATPLVVARPGAALPDATAVARLVSPEKLARIRECVVHVPVMDISATDLRRRVAAGQSIRYRTPRAVEAYIAHHRLYSPTTG